MSAPLSRMLQLSCLRSGQCRKFEYIDPTGEEWSELSEEERDMYRHALEFVFLRLARVAADRYRFRPTTT
jgi:hypothetical protein